MATITQREAEQVERANATGRTPVVFIHGLWLLAGSWERWMRLFEEAGYAPLAPGWPDDPETVEAARANPEILAGKGVGQVADHFAEVIAGLSKKPAIVGHSFGGLLTQILAGRGLSVASVAINPAPFRGVLPLPIAALRSTFPVLRNPANRGRAVALSFEQFRYGWANAIGEEEARRIYDEFHVAAPGKPLFQAAMANFNPRGETGADSKTAARGPLLIFTGGKDHAVPPAMSNAAFKKQRRNPGVTELVEMPGSWPLAGHRRGLARGCRHRSRLRQALRRLSSRMPLTDRVHAWQGRGESSEFRDHAIHTFREEGEGPLLLLLHGFPSSSYDWRLLLDREPRRNVLAFDFLGFGLSAKPRQHDYSLFWQADLTEELVRRYGGGRPVFILAHDMGTSVANELMARDLAGQLEMDIAGILLFNGSMVLEAASPTLAQRALRSRLGPLVAKLSSERVFRQQFGSVFSVDHPLDDAEAADQWSLVCHNGGRTLGHRLVSYMDQREEHAERWHGAIRDWQGELSLAWGLRDPVATTAVLAALRELRPAVPVTELPELAHYPQLEDAGQIASALRGALPSR